MISVERLWNRIGVLTKDGTSGYTTEDEFNSDLYAVRYQILSTLCDNYQNNNKTSNWLINHIKTASITTLANGVLYLPNNYYRDLAILYPQGGVDHETYDLNTNSIGLTMSSPIRKMDVAKNRIGYAYNDGGLVIYPNQIGITVKLIYCKQPDEAKIAFNTASTGEDDYITIDNTNTDDLDFPEGLFNLFVYSMLEYRGIQLKDELTQEYSQLGLNREIVNEIK